MHRLLFVPGMVLEIDLPAYLPLCRGLAGRRTVTDSVACYAQLSVLSVSSVRLPPRRLGYLSREPCQLRQSGRFGQ